MHDPNPITWINPDAASFEGTLPTAIVSGVDTKAAAAINLLMF